MIPYILNLLYQQKKWIPYDKTWDFILDATEDTDFLALYKISEDKRMFIIRLRSDDNQQRGLSWNIKI